MAVIAISRQVGSHGEEIAAVVARELGYELVDRATIHELALSKDPKFRKACEAYESEVGPRGFFEHLWVSEPSFRSLFESLNLELAARGDVVLLGRGAHLVLRDVPGVLKVRVIAPLQLRIKRVAEAKGLSMEQAEAYVMDFGERRRRLLEAIYHQDIADPLLFDLVLNTAELTAQEAAQLVVLAARALGQRADAARRAEVLRRLALAKEVERRVKSELASLAYRQIKVEIDEQGVVRLSGTVADEALVARAGKAAQSVEGVTKVINELSVTPMYF